MRAIVFDQFCGPLLPTVVPVPSHGPDGVLIEVRAAGLCRSDWHGWQGHDPDIKTLPHVGGHEFAGVIAEVGRDVHHWKVGDRVTIPFVAGCGDCEQCRDGAAQVCDRQYQPGFTGWGAFAEFVAVRYADFNLVRLPEELDFVEAASLGCRTATAYRAVALQGRVKPGQWIAVFGCGGVGLSAIAIAAALGARPIGIDIRDEPLALAKELGAELTFRADQTSDVAEAIRDATAGGVHVSLDALGSAATATAAIRSLRKRGRHVQAGLLVGQDHRPRLPMELVLARELEIVGSHGLAAADYGPLMELVVAGRVDVRRMIRRTISLDAAPQALVELGSFTHPGVTIIDSF